MFLLWVVNDQLMDFWSLAMKLCWLDMLVKLDRRQQSGCGKWYSYNIILMLSRLQISTCLGIKNNAVAFTKSAFAYLYAVRSLENGHQWHCRRSSPLSQSERFMTQYWAGHNLSQQGNGRCVHYGRRQSFAMHKSQTGWRIAIFSTYLE